MITADSLARIAIYRKPSHFERWVQPLQKTCDVYHITTAQRRAHFLTQLMHESAELKTRIENLNYSANGLIAKFSRDRISEAQARRYGRQGTRPADQEAIANAVYGGRWGEKHLGNVHAGDGWRFRGRGFMQLTGRANYRRYTQFIQGALDFERDPDLVAELPWAVDVAGWFWDVEKNLNQLADQDNVLAITRRINGGINGLEARTMYLERAKRVLEVV